MVGAPLLIESGYFRAKFAQEEAAAAGGLPFTIVRATQFFEFLGGVADMQTVDGIVRLPAADAQPAAVTEVAGAIAEIAAGTAANGVVEVAGPERRPLAEIVGAWLRWAGDPRSVAETDTARFAGARIGRETLVPGPEALLMSTPFDVWLANR